MILDLSRVDRLPNRRYDVAVVGGGTIGLLLAVALGRAGHSVFVAESGGQTLEEAPQRLSFACSVGREHAGLRQGRIRALGGTSNLWGGQLSPFVQSDFASRSWVDRSGWPISLEDLLPYYDRAATMLGIDATQTDSAIWDAIGAPAPDPDEAVELFLTRWMPETSVARLFAADLAKSPAIVVATHATVTSFRPGECGDEIRGLAIADGQGRTFDVDADHIVICAGTIEASRMLLAAAHSNPALPWSNNRWLGRAFHDHLDLIAAELRPGDTRRFADIFDNIYLRGQKYQPKLRLREALVEKERILNICASIVFRSDLRDHLDNIKLFVRSLRRGLLPSGLAGLPRHLAFLSKTLLPLAKRYLVDRRAFNPAQGGIFLNLHCEQLPLRESRITIDAARTDALGMPRACLYWQIGELEARSAQVFCERVKAAFERAHIAEVRILEDLRVHGDLGRARDSNHHCGGLRMASSSDGGVVDADLRIFGTRNLYAAGACVFPTSGYANPTFTAAALALRLSDHLALRSRPVAAAGVRP